MRHSQPPSPHGSEGRQGCGFTRWGRALSCVRRHLRMEGAADPRRLALEACGNPCHASLALLLSVQSNFEPPAG